jgi:hypothetical protein
MHDESWAEWERPPDSIGHGVKSQVATHSGKTSRRSVSRSAANVAAGAILGFLMTLPLSASAAGFHGYSQAFERTGGSGFTGLRNYRKDQAVSGLPSSGCSTPFIAPVYQTQWVILTADALNWMEIGTGHQCNDNYRYWFWGYGDNGAWFPVGTQAGIANGVFHTFEIQRAFDGTRWRFYFKVDGVTKGNVVGSDTGPEVRVGLESYFNNVTVAGYGNTQLKYQKNGGAFSSWAGRDALQVNAPLCGKWISDTSWWAGENVTC